MVQAFMLDKRTVQLRPQPPVPDKIWMDSGMELVLPREIGDLDEARNLLGKAERVIHAQERRIYQLENLALTDELTGLYNRRGLLLALQRELLAARRDKNASGVLIMMDLDGFKSVNDLWGHAAGDEYLRAVACALLGDVRGNDIVARLGGDEFAIVLTRIGEATGLNRMRRIEESLNSRALQWQHTPIPLRGSFGMAPYRGADKPEAVMASADLKLYAQKARHCQG